MLVLNIGFSMVHAAEPTIDEIVKRALEHETFGTANSTFHARVILTNADGSAEERVMEAAVKAGEQGTKKTMFRFLSPASVAGTAFLMIQRPGQRDEQYMYLPNMHVTRRIAVSGDRDKSFMGTDYTYSDLERKTLRDAKHQRLPDENVGSDPCFHILATPPKDSPYSKQEIWVRKKDELPIRIQMFGRDMKLDKTIFVRRVKSINGRKVVTDTLTTNARNGHRTEIFLENIEMHSELSDSMFRPAALGH
jgi:outer membrane lipoprotein-sorting protein